MCGFVGLKSLGGQGVPIELIRRMVAHLARRGPDDAGEYVEHELGFGFRRLSILDLTNAAHQPMEAPDGSAVLVFNGQIFNYVELREELRSLGHQFRSTGDTEVLLHAYLQWGYGCLPRLNGEWAFLVWDRRTRMLFGARDRMGIKPMYRLQTNGFAGWASEIKALLELPGYRPAVNWSVARAYLRHGRMDHSVDTFFQGIQAVRPGHAFVVKPDGGERNWAYWTVPDEQAGSDSPDLAEEFAELFEDAVRLRLRSDVPLGVCLSGGLDSTAIVCAAARAQPESISVFSYQHPAFDERRFISATVARTGARLHSLEADHAELWDLADQVVRAHDEPVHTLTAMVGYELMRMIAGCGIRVILNGQGSDEVLAGYDSYFQDAWFATMRSGRPLDAWREIRRYASVHGGGSGALLWQTVRRVIQAGLRRAAPYRRLVHEYHQAQDLRTGWFVGPVAPPSEVSSALPATLPEVLREATTTFPLPLYLRIEDRNSMAHSVEARLPFLDYRLVEFAFRVVSEWKIRGAWNKVLLREAMRGRIPEIVRTRPDKMGFPSPTGSLLRNGSFDRLYALVSSRTARERGIYSWDRMTRELLAHKDKPNPELAGQFFRVAQFELWATTYGL
jgi:asparagine synthase (glutamine-hydrolysing)